MPLGDLLLLDWVPRHEFVTAPLAFYLFDGGVLDGADRIRLQEDELEEFGFFPPGLAATLTAEVNPGRVELALEARRTGRMAYQPTR